MASLALRDDALREGLDTVDHAPQIDVDDPAPVVVGHVHDRATHGNARVEEDDVNGAHLLESGIGERLHGRAVAHVAQHAFGSGALRAQLRNRGVERGALDVGEHEAHALACQRLRGREPDPAGATRDHRHAVG